MITPQITNDLRESFEAVLRRRPPFQGRGQRLALFNLLPVPRATAKLSLAVLVLLTATITLSAQVMSGGKYEVTSSVQASGGGASAGGGKMIEGTAGQTSAGGPLANSTLVQNPGFWFTTAGSVSAAPSPTPSPSPTPTPAAIPTISISDVTQTEGNSGTSSFTFLVTLSSASTQPISVNYLTADGTATNNSDYQAGSGSLMFGPGETSKPLVVLVNGDTQVEPNEAFAVTLFSPVNATIAKGQAAATIINDDSGPITTFQLSAANYSVQEDLTALTLTVNRSGDVTGAASVDYVTLDGSAVQKSDFEYAAGTLKFAPGEISKTFQVLINEDIYTEGSESFQVVLSNPIGASLGEPSAATVNITDDAVESSTNPLDLAQSFVHTQYHDFLNREPDAAGLAFWTNQITSCGNNTQCIDAKRVNVSAAFFLSIEFQETGYLRYLLEKESFGSTAKYAEFTRDLQAISRGVIVHQAGWEQKLKDNQQQFADEWVNRPAFKAAYEHMSNSDYVNALYTNAGILTTQAERQSLVEALDTGESRAKVLLDVAANNAFRQREQSSAFVLMQYFGYLLRDPSSAPDSDLSGYNFWLNKLNAFDGDYLKAEMVKAFIISTEYRQRFGQ